MATIVHEQPIAAASPLEGLRVSWGGIWGGVLVVMGTMLLLTTLGIAIGVSAAEPQQTQAGEVGTAAAVWTGLSLLIALFVGGMAATRLGVILDRTTGVLEGALVWVLSLLIILYLASSGVRLIASSVAGLFSGVAQTVGSTLTGMENLSTGNVDQILQRLRDPQTARTIASATGMSEQEISTRLNDIAQRVEAARNDPARVAAEVRDGTREMMQQARERLPAAAQQAQRGATKAAWITFAAMLISLGAAIAGSMVGRRGVATRVGERVAGVTEDIPRARGRW